MEEEDAGEEGSAIPALIVPIGEVMSPGLEVDVFSPAIGWGGVFFGDLKSRRDCLL